MDVAALKDLIAVVDAGSISRAAQAAGLSQPAMSQRMAQLEQEVGRRLFERGPRGVEPTAAGLELYRGAQQVVRQIDRLADDLGAGTRDVRGTVSLGVPATVAAGLVPDLVRLVGERHPGIHLELFESMSGYVQELLGRGRLDLAVLFRDPASRDDHDREVPLYDEELFLATASGRPHPPRPVDPRDLADRPLVAPGTHSNLRDLVERACTTHGVRPRVVADVESLAAMVRIAQSGDADAVLPRSVAAAYPGPELAFRPFDPPLRRRAVAAVAPEFYEPRLAVLATRDAVVDAVHRAADAGTWAGIDPVRPQPPSPHRRGPRRSRSTLERTP